MLRNLAVLLNANLPLVAALTLLSDTAKPKDKIMIYQIKSDVESGIPFSKACAKFPKIHSSITCKLLEAGERAAALPLVLNNLADYQEKISQFKSKVYKSLFYPVVVLIMAIIIATALLLLVVPQFENLFSSMGAQLPFLTQLVLGLSAVIHHYGVIVLMVIAGISVAIYFYRHVWIHAPFIRELHIKIRLAFMTRTLAMLLDAGVPLVDGLFLLDESRVRTAILRGEMFSNALQSTARFSPLMIQLIKVGEASGTLSVMLNRMAVMMEADIDAVLSRITQLLEPCVMILMGVFIGGLVVAMYLPVFQLGRVV